MPWGIDWRLGGSGLELASVNGLTSWRYLLVMGLAAPRPLSENLTYLPCVSLAEIFTGVYYFLPLCPTLVASIFFCCVRFSFYEGRDTFFLWFFCEQSSLESNYSPYSTTIAAIAVRSWENYPSRGQARPRGGLGRGLG